MTPWFAIFSVLFGCKTIEMGKYAPDPNYPPDMSEDTGPFEDPNAPVDCEESPPVNWVNFGQGFFIQSCQGCHYSEAPYRYGAPENVVFDDLEQVWEQRAMVLHTATGPTPTMPPNGGTTDLEREMLEIWLTCALPGT